MQSEKFEEESPANRDNISNDAKKRGKYFKETPFKGPGLMKFDDFNYGAIN